MFVLLFSLVGAPALLEPTSLASGSSFSASFPRAAVEVAVAPDVIDDLLATGKQKLLKGDNAGALEAFEQANGLAAGAPRTELWVLRAMMSNGRKNDAIKRADELDRAGTLTGAPNDYLSGMFAYLLAEELVAAGSQGAAIGLHYEDAKTFLKRAVEAAPDEFVDAWRTLAKSARMTGDGETAEVGVLGALARLPEDPETLALAAQILVANGVPDLGSEDTARAAAAQAKVRRGAEMAERAASLYGADSARASARASAIAGAHLQRGVALLWLGEKEAAQGAYTDALEWDPTQVDFGQLWPSLLDDDKRPVPFIDVLGKGAARFEKRWGKSTHSDSTLLWWLGFGEFSLGRYEPAEEHFIAAVTKFPAYTNSWWYAGLCRYNRQDYVGAVPHWRKHWAIAPQNLVDTVRADLGTNIPILTYVEGTLYKKGHLADAVFVAQIKTAVAPEDDKAWNNVGLFARDTGDGLRRAGKERDEHHTVAEYYDLAYAAYERANELKPNQPHYLNDWAVILHFCLDRDHQRALDMYANATELAERMLKQGGLDDETKGLVEIALRDSKDNRARLVKTLEERKKQKDDAGTPPADGGGDGSGGQGGSGYGAGNGGSGMGGGNRRAGQGGGGAR